MTKNEKILLIILVKISEIIDKYFSLDYVVFPEEQLLKINEAKKNSEDVIRFFGLTEFNQGEIQAALNRVYNVSQNKFYNTFLLELTEEYDEDFSLLTGLCNFNEVLSEVVQYQKLNEEIKTKLVMVNENIKKFFEFLEKEMTRGGENGRG